MSDAAVPTGCYKCGRPGHWSRDCPSSTNDPTPESSSTPTPNTFSKPTTTTTTTTTFKPKSGSSSAAPKPKKAPRTRPKITPDLLLSDQGLGYILRYFPRNFKYRGRGHEVNDLRNLLRMYAEWHSQLIPYFPFDQFIHKVEDAGSRRVKSCIADLKDRVANGGDPTKLNEPVPENETLHNKEDVNMEEPAKDQDDFLFNGDDANDMHKDSVDDLYEKTIVETSQSVEDINSGANTSPTIETTKQSDPSADGGTSSSGVQVTQEQKALMEANRLKALERAAARSRLLKST